MSMHDLVNLLFTYHMSKDTSHEMTRQSIFWRDPLLGWFNKL